MRKITKVLALVLALCMIGAIAVGCSGKNDTSSSKADDNDNKTNATGKVYYLNFKPEANDAWQNLAKAYKEETGVEVKVVTAASGEYESTLKAEMAKTDAPTLFQVNGPVGLASWKDYCYDLKDSEIVSKLSNPDFALKDGDKTAGVAYVIETYGLIYNKTLFKKYCDLDGAKCASIDDINSFAKLKEVVEDMQAHKADLGIDGAFTSAGMDGSSDWRFKTHLANLPIYYEYKADGIDSTEAIKGTYLDNYKNIWDLYINNATCEPKLISGKTADDAVSEFAMSKAVFYQNGTWAYTDIKNAETLQDDELGMLPIYIGVDGEENQGLCTGTENYWCVNSKASQEDIDATLAFMNWCISSDKGLEAMCSEMGFVVPFSTMPDKYAETNPLVKEANNYVKAGKTPVSWNFTTMPSEDWKNGVGTALLQYAQGSGDWDAVKTAFVDGWATEYQKANNG